MSRAAPPEPAFRPVAPRHALRRRGRAGFTLIEVLVALAVAAIILAAVARLTGANVRAARALEERTGLLQTAAAVETGIPPRAELRPGRTDGAIGELRWRMDVRPMEVAGVPEGGKWAARDVLIRVRAPSGALVLLETVRLVPVVAQ
ncbi:prepilin-type N-terminal cleavage/methylation domain-containing protein [Xanthobacter sp. V3C-3]|uniref:prepilin-type N-terminal cleavage/methylation domain-containing protein n=1 Tax=Xanthobacter lutulentifluminis TaxID=3119935 RepID=UPI003727ADAE